MTTLGSYRCSTAGCWCEGGRAAADDDLDLDQRAGVVPQLYIEAESFGTAVLLTLEGELCAETTDDLRKRIDAAVEHGARQLIVSLAGVGHLDPAGLDVLLATRRFLRLSSGDLIIAEPSVPALQAIGMHGAGSMLTATATLAAALERVTRGAPAGGS